MLILSLLLVVAEAPAYDLLLKMLPALLVALVMMCINIYRDAGKRHEDRIKHLEVKAIEAEGRFTNTQLEHEAYADKMNLRLVGMDAKLENVEKLNLKVNSLSAEMQVMSEKLSSTQRLSEKMDAKLDRLLDELRRK